MSIGKMNIKSTLNTYSFIVFVQLFTRISQTIKLDHKRVKKANNVNLVFSISKIYNRAFYIVPANISEIKMVVQKKRWCSGSEF